MVNDEWLMVRISQEERWKAKYDEVKGFIETNHRNPSKYVNSERGLRNWVKQQKKLMNAGVLVGQCLKMSNELLALGGRYKKVLECRSSQLTTKASSPLPLK